MFTGLIENIGTVSSIKRAGGGLKISICPESAIELQIGDSVSINGVCLTVVETAGILPLRYRLRHYEIQTLENLRLMIGKY